MTKRAVQQVADAGPRLLPEGKGTKVLKRVAVIGALVDGGLPLIAAARLAAILPENFNEVDGELPSGLQLLARLSARSMPKGLLSDNDYWLHQALVRFSPMYRPGIPSDQDVVIEIADRRHVFMRMHAPSPIPEFDPLTGDDLPEGRDYIARIDGWSRGAEPLLIAASALVSYDREALGFREQADSFVRMRRETWERRVAVLTVNVSLAIRNALDRLDSFRTQKGALA